MSKSNYKGMADVRIDQIGPLIEICHASGMGQVPVFEGDVGVGKTAAVKAYAAARKEKLGRPTKVVTLIASQMEPSDIGAMPVIGEVEITNAHNEPEKVMSQQGTVPDWALAAFELHKEGTDILVFWDEITNTPPATQAALLSVVLEREIAGSKLPPNVIFAMASNPPDYAADGTAFTAPMANRLVHYKVRMPTVMEWVKGFETQWGADYKIGPNGKKQQKTLTPAEEFARKMVVGFLLGNEASLHVRPARGADASGAWPSPRSWQGVSQAMSAMPGLEAACEEQRKAKGTITDDYANFMATAAGLLGEAVATEFLTFITDFDLPPIEDLISGKAKLNSNTRLDHIWVVLYGLTGKAREFAEKQNRAEAEAGYNQCLSFLLKTLQDDFGHIVTIDILTSYARKLMESNFHCGPNESGDLKPFKQPKDLDELLTKLDDFAVQAGEPRIVRA